MRAILFFILSVSISASAKYVSPCDQKLDQFPKKYYEICQSEELLLQFPEMIYNCIVEYNLDSNWIQKAQELKADPNILCAMERPLTRAAQVRPQMVPVLLSLGADPNSKDARCQSAISWSVVADNFDAFQALVAAGADLVSHDGKQMDESGNCTPVADRDTPFLHAASWGREKFIEYYLQNKLVDIEEFGFYGMNALMNAADKVGCKVCGDYVKSVELLLKAGAKVNVLSQPQANDTITNAQSPLFYAAFRGHLQAMKLLIQAGADVHYVNPNGIRIMDGAKHSMFFQKEKIKLLCDLGVKDPVCKKK